MRHPFPIESPISFENFMTLNKREQKIITNKMSQALPLNDIVVLQGLGL